MAEILLYKTANQDIRLEVLIQNETIWLNQKQLCELFARDKSVISRHIKNILNENELELDAVVAKNATTARDGKKYIVDYYNLDMIISVGYRVNSSKATQFRIWATKILKEFIIKGFAMDDERMKNGQYFGKDYFKELLERVRSIRASERRIYQQITDIFAECSFDYDKNSQTTKDFYATVQNKFHFAITGKTAAEIVYENADISKQNMGLTSWKNSPDGRVLKSDTSIAKNYLQEDDIKKLERTIGAYFDYIERIIENRQELRMKDVSESVNKFLEFNEFEVLEGKGSISHMQAKEKASKEYEEFNKIQKIESDFDKEMKKLLS
ncbi:MAG: hypothetical protein ACI9RG_000537 [Sulfurimonas sp.]|jgi:hypothetical protein